MPITPVDPPKQTVTVGGDAHKKVLVFVEGPNYADSFGYEWKSFRDVYVDSDLGVDLSLTRLEQNLGMPTEFLKGMDVLEIGCGSGRFTEHLIKRAAHVTALDYSDAVFSNVALGAPNLTAMKADVLDLPKFSGRFDLVFCRGVIQHTRDPKRALQTLFELAAPGGLVIFDVYRKNPGYRRTFKYFFRPIVQKRVPIERFHAFLDAHGERLYRWHHRVLKLYAYAPLLQRLIAKTPLHLSTNWEKKYAMLTRAQRLESFKTEMIDALYAHYDMPMSPQEVIDALAEVGQRPYHFDDWRNQYRCKNTGDARPIKVSVVKDGVFRLPL